MGDVVLDNTMGSGSTCVAADMEKRHYIGIEKEQKYYDIAKKRIEMLKNEPELDFDYEWFCINLIFSYLCIWN